jgi:pimeloyl-ACP methyl ester carboxylesterase
MKTKSADGCEIAFDVTGGGDTVILLHGFSQSRSLWAHYGWVERLSGKFSVITIDLRGCGESGQPTESKDYAIVRHLADVDAVLQALDVEYCSVWGWSFGGTLALQLAKRGQTVKSALIAGTYFGKVFTDRYVRERQAGTADELARTRWEGLRSWPSVAPKEMSCPTAVYSGTQDGNVAVQLEAQRQEIESAGIELQIFPDLKHGELLSKADVVEEFVTRNLAR